MPSRMHLRLLTPAVPTRGSTQDDDVSSYYRSISRLEALRIVADAAHLPLLIFFALFFAAGMYVGRWSVVFETRQRRKHLAEAVAGVVDGVLAGTSKGTNPGATTDDDMTSAVIEGVLEGLRAGGAASKGPASSFQSHSKANRGTRPAPSTTPDVTSDAAGSSARRGRSKRSSADPLDDVLSRELRAAEAEAAATKRKIDAADVDGTAEDAGENEAPIEDDEARPSSEPEPIGDVEMMDAATPSASSVGTRSRRTPVKDDDAAAAVEPEEEPEEEPEDGGDEEDVVSSRLAPDPPPVESPTRTHAREAEWSSRQAEIERQRAESTRLKKAAKSARLVNERVETYRRGLEEREALESAMGDARAEAQRSFERDGVHDLAAAGCLEHVLHRLGLLPNPDENRDVGKVEVAFKKALARNHPDRSASRGDDVRAGARCEEAFKLLQAAKARWDAAGKPVGLTASQTAASVLGVSTHYGYHPQQQQPPQSSSRSTFTSPHTQQKGRSWQPGGHTQTPGASVPGAGGFDSNSNDAWREQAKRTAAATADALRREEERMRLELEERERLEREREAREAFERKLRDLSRKTSGGDETGAWVQGSDASEEGTPRHPDAMNGKDDRKKRPPPNDFQ